MNNGSDFWRELTYRFERQQAGRDTIGPTKNGAHWFDSGGQRFEGMVSAHPIGGLNSTSPRFTTASTFVDTQDYVHSLPSNYLVLTVTFIYAADISAGTFSQDKSAKCVAMGTQPIMLVFPVPRCRIV